VGKLTAVGVKALRTEGRYLDGQGLALVVREGGQRYWTYRYTCRGRERLMSLGNADSLSLARARELHAKARAIVLAGGDPLADRQQSKVAPAEHRFAEAAESYIQAHESSWHGKRTAETWRQSLADHVFPKLGQKPVAEIDRDDVLCVLTPIWTTIPESAARIRGRIEAIVAYAIARDWRTDANPAVWRGGLAMLLPRSRKVRPIEHHAALDWRDAPAFMAKLRELTTIHAMALQFIILTAARSGEVRGAKWHEIDLERATWTVPPERMKARKLYRVPLSDAAMEVLERMAAVRTGELVFFGRKLGQPLTDMSLLRVLWALDHKGITVHGFRSTFRDWCGDTGKSADAAEAALAHAPASRVVAAYARSDLLEQRRGLMDAWASFLAGSMGVVVPLRRSRPPA
jgi:integrase